MKKSPYLALGLASVFAASVWYSCGSSENKKKVVVQETDSVQLLAQRYFQPLSADAENPDNPSTAEKIELGKMLYYDTRLSAKGNNSCNSCHDLAKFGVDNEPTSAGDDGKKGDRNSPTVLNAALNSQQFWDGRAKDVEEQAGMPILNPVEMHIPNKEFLVKKLSAVPEYKTKFAAAFPGENNPLTYENIQKAIGAFERTLLTPSKFDDYVKGDASALSADEKKGLETFVKVGCTTCHTGSLLGGTMFMKFGLYGNYMQATGSKKVDYGKFSVTKQPSDSFVFKVCGLRNVNETGPYFHDGSVASLNESVKIMAKLQLNKELTEEEVNSIVTFLKTLTGKVPDSAKPSKS